MLADQKGKSKQEVESWTGYPGGAPCNVAAGLGQLDIPTAFVSCLGKDDKGDELFELLTGRGVDMSAVRRVDHPTRDVYVVRHADGDRVFDSFGQDTNTYCDCFIEPDQLPEAVIRGAAVTVMGTLGLAYTMTGAAMNRAADIARAGSGLLLVDVNWRPVFWNDPASALDIIMPFVQKADLVKITDEESEWAFGIPAEEAIEQPSRVLEKLPNARGVLVTAGGSGSSFCFRVAGKGDVSGHVPVYEVDVQDTTGAGDAFTCGFLAYVLAEEGGNVDAFLSDGEKIQKAVEFASACGALTTMSGGAIAPQPKLHAIEKLVASRTGAAKA